MSPALHPPERPSHTHSPKPAGFGGSGHDVTDANWKHQYTAESFSRDRDIVDYFHLGQLNQETRWRCDCALNLCPRVYGGVASNGRWHLYHSIQENSSCGFTGISFPRFRYAVSVMIPQSQMPIDRARLVRFPRNSKTASLTDLHIDQKQKADVRIFKINHPHPSSPPSLPSPAPNLVSSL